MNRIAIFVLSACLSVLPSARGGPQNEEKKTLLRFTSFGLTHDRGDEYVLAAKDKQSDPFTIPNNGFSTVVPVPTQDETAFALGKAGQPSFQNLATVTLPKIGKRFLVIFLPDKENMLRAIVIRADDPKFRPGQIMILNLAQEPLAADLGGRKLTFAPASRTIFRPQHMGDLANYQVRFFRSKDGEAKLFAASLWPYFEDKRAFVFLYTDPTTGAHTYRSIDEFTGWLDK